jgi:hypothetical protein
VALSPPLRDLLDSAISSLLDSNPISFRAIDEKGVGPVKAACRKPTGITHSLRPPLNRNAFLCGCSDLTENETTEHLIVGFGRLWRATTRITALGHAVGTTESVDIPDQIRDAIHHHVASGNCSEVLMFHNHPRNPLNMLIDNLPLASIADRKTLLTYLLKPEILLKGILSGGRLRFYLGENGYVREFRTPALLSLLDSLLQRQVPTSDAPGWAGGADVDS